MVVYTIITIYTNADVDGVLPDATFEETAAAVTTESSIVFAVATITTHGADSSQGHCTT